MKTTNDKIVEMVAIALETKNSYQLFKLSSILEKRGAFEKELNELVKSIETNE